jgi:hypothetical protein
VVVCALVSSAGFGIVVLAYAATIAPALRKQTARIVPTENRQDGCQRCRPS